MKKLETCTITEIDVDELAELKRGYSTYKAKLQVIWSLLTHKEAIRVSHENKDVSTWFNNDGVPK